VAEAARKAKAAQQQRADEADQARGLEEMPQQDQVVPDLPEQGEAEGAQSSTAHRDQPGATSWERPAGARKPWDQSPD
jgi:hypothetical protein